MQFSKKWYLGVYTIFKHNPATNFSSVISFTFYVNFQVVVKGFRCHDEKNIFFLESVNHLKECEIYLEVLAKCFSIISVPKNVELITFGHI